MKKLTTILFLLLGWLQYSLWFGKNGVHDLIHIKNNITIQKNKNLERQMCNKQLLIEVNDLNKGQESIEERARNELGMIKTGETFYRLMTKHTKLNTIRPTK